MADDNTVYRAIKYRVYPTDAQSEKLSQTFGCARKVYNDALSMQRGLYEAGMPTFGQTALNAYCNRVWKDEFPFLTEVDKFALTNSLYALCAAYKKKGSNRYFKQKARVSKLSRTVANQRLDFCHKLSRKIANSYDAVCVEDIDLSAMAQTLKFGKAVSDNGFGMFRTFLQYKLAEQGKYYIVIDKWYPSTKTCRHCGSKNPDVQLGQMEWVCPHCGAVIDRDLNAAINIRNEGLTIAFSLRTPYHAKTKPYGLSTIVLSLRPASAMQTQKNCGSS